MRYINYQYHFEEEEEKKKKRILDSRCPLNRCSEGEICSVRSNEEYGCCLSDDNCRIGFIHFLK